MYFDELPVVKYEFMKVLGAPLSKYNNSSVNCTSICSVGSYSLKTVKRNSGHYKTKVFSPQEKKYFIQE